MGENSQSSVEEVISIEDGSATAGGGSMGGGTSSKTAQQQHQQSLIDQQTAQQQPFNNTSATIAFSKKAIHQRDADENLFLRFLELDPPDGVVAPAPNILLKPDGKDGGTPSSMRRKSTLPTVVVPPTTVPPIGRTPFTITKKLARTGDKGFGFSIVWTHPPRIEKVESGLSADRSGIIPGDYVIFVDKHNVVTMPEMDILNLIRSQGNILLLEIFRRPNSRTANGIKARATLTSSALNEAAIALDEDALGSSSRQPSIVSALGQIKPTAFPGTPAVMVAAPRSSTTLCSNTSETTSKRRLNLPQVTFSKEVGQGVIV